MKEYWKGRKAEKIRKVIKLFHVVHSRPKLKKKEEIKYGSIILENYLFTLNDCFLNGHEFIGRSVFTKTEMSKFLIQ